jgi:hypothetical protein
MISIRFLFERTANEPLQRAQSPTAERDTYIQGTLKRLRSRIGKGVSGVKSKELQSQIKNYQKNKYNNNMGSLQY